MVISKSGKKQKAIARAFIFSGRPDPSWTVTNTLMKQLENIWNSLEVTHEIPSAPTHGYRGCLLNDKIKRKWFVYKNIIRLSTNGFSETRLDKYSKFEKLLLSSAPPGILPF
jgi:hypothetical protein